MLLISDLHIIIIFSLSFFVHECVHVMRGKSWKYHFFTCTMQEFSGSMNCPFSDSSAKFLFSDSSEVSSFPFSYFLHPLSLSLSPSLCVSLFMLSWKTSFFTCTMLEFSGHMNCPFSDSSDIP